MNTSERKALRESLIACGFERTGYTTDPTGSGIYKEVWELGDNHVHIYWGVKDVG